MSSPDHFGEVTKTPEFRREVRRLFRRRVLWTRRYWAGIAVYSTCFGVMMAMIDWFAVPARKLFLYWMPRWLDRPLMSGLIGAALGLALQFFFRKPALRCRWEALNNRGIPVCMNCGYDLRGQVEPRCPECGTPMRQ